VAITSCAGSHGLFDPDLSKAFFGDPVLPRPAAAAAAAEAPLPVVLHFQSRVTPDGFEDSPGRINI